MCESVTRGRLLNAGGCFSLALAGVLKRRVMMAAAGPDSPFNTGGCSTAGLIKGHAAMSLYLPLQSAGLGARGGGQPVTGRFLERIW